MARGSSARMERRDEVRGWKEGKGKMPVCTFVVGFFSPTPLRAQHSPTQIQGRSDWPVFTFVVGSVDPYGITHVCCGLHRPLRCRSAKRLQ